MMRKMKRSSAADGYQDDGDVVSAAALDRLAGQLLTRCLEAKLLLCQPRLLLNAGLLWRQRGRSFV